MDGAEQECSGYLMSSASTFSRLQAGNEPVVARKNAVFLSSEDFISSPSATFGTGGRHAQAAVLSVASVLRGHT
jgi:hypothetical protein